MFCVLSLRETREQLISLLMNYVLYAEELMSSGFKWALLLEPRNIFFYLENLGYVCLYLYIKFLRLDFNNTTDY